MNQGQNQEQNQQHEQTYRFLCHLATISNREWRRNMKDNSTLRETYNSLIGDNMFFPLNKAVPKLLRNEHMRIPETRPKRGRIVLPPVLGEPLFVPLLSVEWDFSGMTQTGYGFRLDMLRIDRNLFSIRFEKGVSGTDHDFLHVQVNDESEGIHPVNDISWLCCTKPCIPLCARQRDSPVSLLILLYATLYGFEQFDRHFRGAGIRGEYYEEIRPFLESR